MTSDPVAQMLDFNRKVIDEFRANGGKVTGRFAGAPLLLLTTTGAKSGEKRTTPLVHSSEGDDIIIIASYAGGPKHPAWFLNLRANPEVTIELPNETFTVNAVIPEGEERQRLFDQTGGEDAAVQRVPGQDQPRDSRRRHPPPVTPGHPGERNPPCPVPASSPSSTSGPATRPSTPSTPSRPPAPSGATATGSASATPRVR